jgi:hypothetical protein
MSILNVDEKEAFDSPPVFNSVQRKKYFDVTPRIASTLQKLQSPTNQVCFLVIVGYFKATKRFFGRRFREPDVQYVARQLGLLPELIQPQAYEDTTYRRHQQFACDLLGFRRWDDESRRFVTDEIRGMVRSQARAKFIFRHVIDILEHRHFEIPSSWALSDMILEETKQHKRRLTATIDTHLPQATRDFLEGLLTTPASDDTDTRLHKSRLALMKRISQSMRPSKIKVSVDDFRTLRDLYRNVEPVIDLLDLTPEGIRYYAEAVLRSKVYQVTQRGDEDRYLHLICFAAHQCFRLQDTLVDILLAAVQNTSGSCQREHKELYYDSRNERRQTVRRFLNRVDEGALTPLADIELIAFDAELEDSDKVQQIQAVFAAAQERRDSATENLDGLRRALEPHAADAEYYRALEAKSIKLQNRVSEIVKVVEFHGASDALMEAIEHYKERDGAVAQSAPAGFLAPDEQRALFDEGGKFRVSLHKALLFFKIAEAVKAGALNLTLSYKHRSLDDYLIPKATWDTNREELLERAELVQASDCKMMLDSLSATLHRQYEETNRHVEGGENKHVRFHKDGRFHVTTPKIEDSESEPVSSLFPSGRYISLLEVLSTVNRLSSFLDAFEPWQTKYARSKPPSKTFFAGTRVAGGDCPGSSASAVDFRGRAAGGLAIAGTSRQCRRVGGLRAASEPLDRTRRRQRRSTRCSQAGRPLSRRLPESRPSNPVARSFSVEATGLALPRPRAGAGPARQSTGSAVPPARCLHQGDQAPGR